LKRGKVSLKRRPIESKETKGIVKKETVPAVGVASGPQRQGTQRGADRLSKKVKRSIKSEIGTRKKQAVQDSKCDSRPKGEPSRKQDKSAALSHSRETHIETTGEKQQFKEVKGREAVEGKGGGRGHQKRAGCLKRNGSKWRHWWGGRVVGRRRGGPG